MKTFAVAVTLSILSIAGCTDSQPPTKSATGTSVPADARAGRIAAERNCQVCHGLDGRGAAPGIPHLAGQRERYLLQTLQEYTAAKRPHGSAPATLRAVSDADQRNVAAYYATLSAVSATAGQEAVPSADSGKFAAASCAKCHGEDGNSQTPGVPSLAGQPANYLLAALHQYQNGERSASAMHSTVPGTDEAQLKAVSVYFSSRIPMRRAGADKADVNAGRTASAACAGCHGSDGVSHDMSIPNLAGQDAAYLLEAIHGYRTKTGHWGMQHHVVDLTENDARNVAGFFAVQAPPQAASAEHPAASAAQQCDRCHDAENEAMPVPRLKGQDKDYLVAVMRGYRDGSRASSAMHKMSAAYNDATIDSLATWYASAKPN